MSKQLEDGQLGAHRSLIKRYRQGLLRMPVEVGLNGSVAFRHTRHMLVPDSAGVYLIHDLRGVLYVGRSVNLYRRFHEHYWLTDNQLLSLAMRQPFGEMTFSWVLVEDGTDRVILETRLITWLRPACNRLQPVLND